LKRQARNPQWLIFLYEVEVLYGFGFGLTWHHENALQLVKSVAKTLTIALHAMAFIRTSRSSPHPQQNIIVD
jgi:hypothetical protein